MILRNNKTSNLYCKDSKVVKFKAKTGEVFDIEIIEEPKEKLKKENYGVINDMRNITKTILGKAGGLIDKWFYSADFLLMARRSKNQESMGFSTGRYLDNNLVLLHSSMIMPQVRHIGLAFYMNSIILRNILKLRLKGARWKFWRCFLPVYFGLRTPNPVVYEILSKNLRVFPSLTSEDPPHVIKNLAVKIAKTVSPECEFDIQKFVIKKAFSFFPELLYEVEEIPEAKDKRINDFFEQCLRLTKREGNALVVIGKLPFPLIFALRG